jgi:rhodanese-related sulfurtransferase
MAKTGREMIEAARQAVSAMSNADLHAKLTAGENIVVLDIREQEEWNAGHIPQGTFLARGRIEGKAEEIVPDKSTPIVTH